MGVSRTRARGVLLGLACGDALGRPVEGWPQRAIEREYGTLDGMVGDGAHRLPAGCITDDSEMARCVARSLVDRRSFDPDDVARRFVDWYESGPTGIGGLTRRVLDRVARGQDWRVASRSVWEESPEGRNAGNGSVMRSAPVALALPDDPDRLADASRTASRITHVDPRCTAGCAVLNVVVANLLRGDHPVDALDQAVGRVDPPAELRAALEPIPDRPLDELAVTGYVVHTLETALQIALTSTNIRDAIVQSVNMGGDTDTIGAVAGAVAGARFGAAELPGSWLEVLEAREELEGLADALAEGSG